MNPTIVLWLVRHRRQLRPLAWAVLLTPLAIALTVTLTLILFLGSGGPATGTPAQVPGIPNVMLAAYRNAADRTPTIASRCTGMRWPILAAIAEIESNHAAGHHISPTGDISPPILGPRLDGSGAGGNHTPIHDTDHAQWDSNQTYDRATGPFQFIPTTWQTHGQDGNDDGIRNPHNAFDAALAAAVYLCGADVRDLSDPDQLSEAIYAYNHSQDYVTRVLDQITTYDTLDSTTPAHQATGTVRTVLDTALAQLGVPYAWGGGNATGPTRGSHDNGGPADAHGDYNKIGFDCSGLTVYAYAQTGITLPRTSAAQYTTGTHIPREAGLSALRPADLVFYATSPTTGTGIHHVGIYLGNSTMINAPYSGTTVRIDPINPTQYAGAARLLP